MTGKPWWEVLGLNRGAASGWHCASKKNIRARLLRAFWSTVLRIDPSFAPFAEGDFATILRAYHDALGEFDLSPEQEPKP